MANNFYGGIALTGGAEGALDRIDGAILNDGDGAMVIDSSNDKVYFYTLNASSGAAESSPDTISPDSNAGNKRWILVLTQSFQASFARTLFGSTTLATFLTNAGLAYDYLWIPAKAWTPHTTNGCDDVVGEEFATDDDVMISYLAFDATTEEYAGFNMVMPATWDLGTIKAKFYWKPASGCSQGDTVEWQLQGAALGDDDNIDTTEFTDTGEVISDTVLAGVENDLHISGATPAITINNTPALEDNINFKVSRNVGGTDDMAEDAHLIGVLIQYGISESVSAW